MVFICSTHRDIWYHVVLICIIPHKLTHLSFEKKNNQKVTKIPQNHFKNRTVSQLARLETDAKKILLTQKQAFIEKSIIFTQSL